MCGSKDKYGSIVLNKTIPKNGAIFAKKSEICKGIVQNSKILLS